jgi:hypothetical protein
MVGPSRSEETSSALARAARSTLFENPPASQNMLTSYLPVSPVASAIGAFNRLTIMLAIRSRIMAI